MEEEDEIQTQACKFPRFGNGGRNDHPINNKIAPRDHHNILHNEDVENIGGGGGGGEVRTRRGVGGIGDGGTTTIPPTTANNNRLHNWHHSSRIIRVSRASGGKDRHSKVMTSKGLRDRRVRLSVTTAIQFYDLQDRLGYDQSSKAVEWLIKSAADAISELPSLNNTFPDTPKQLSDEKRGDLGLIEQGFADDSADAGLDHGDEGNYNNTQQQQNQSQNLSLSKSACSSTSETSKGSGLSLSRSDIRVKARERARERAAKEKKKDTNNESLHQINAHHQHHQNMNPVSQTASFTELLTGGINNAAVQTTNSPTGSVHQNHGSDEPNNLFNKAAARQQQQHQWGSAPMEMDYFSPLFLGASSSSRTQQQQHQSSSSGFSSAPQFQLGHSLAEAMSFNVVSGGDSQNHNHHHHSSADQMQLPFSFIHDHLMPAVVTSSHQQPGGNNTNSHSHNNNDYNLNFTMLSSSSSLGLAGYNNNNRGTLQSNSSHPSSNNNNNNLLPHHHHHLQRFSVPTMDGSTVPFFFGAAAAAAPVASAAAAMESHNHHQHQLFSPVFDGRLQLCYGGGDGSRHSDQKGKAKN